MRWTEPWYSAYALVGMMVLGVAPILIPLTVEQGGGGEPADRDRLSIGFGGVWVGAAPYLSALTSASSKRCSIITGV